MSSSPILGGRRLLEFKQVSACLITGIVRKWFFVRAYHLVTLQTLTDEVIDPARMSGHYTDDCARR